MEIQCKLWHYKIDGPSHPSPFIHLTSSVIPSVVAFSTLIQDILISGCLGIRDPWGDVWMPNALVCWLLHTYNFLKRGKRERLGWMGGSFWSPRPDFLRIRNITLQMEQLIAQISGLVDWQDSQSLQFLLSQLQKLWWCSVPIDKWVGHSIRAYSLCWISPSVQLPAEWGFYSMFVLLSKLFYTQDMTIAFGYISCRILFWST